MKIASTFARQVSSVFSSKSKATEMTQIQRESEVYFDVATGNKFKALPSEQGFDLAVFFAIGGGSFHEFENFAEFQGFRTIYGCDYLFSPSEFLNLLI